MLDTEPNCVDAVFEANSDQTALIDLGDNCQLVRIEIPADSAWTPANLTLLAARNGGDPLPVYLETAQYQITTAAAGRVIVLTPSVTFGLGRYLMLKSSAIQTGKRTLKLVTTPL